MLPSRWLAKRASSYPRHEQPESPSHVNQHYSLRHKPLSIFWVNISKFWLQVPSLARSVPKPLKEPSLARSVPKPLKVPTLARSMPKPFKWSMWSRGSSQGTSLCHETLLLFAADLLLPWLGKLGNTQRNTQRNTHRNTQRNTHCFFGPLFFLNLIYIMA